MLAILCLSAISVLVALFAFAVPKADPLIGLVACWALLAIFAELGNPDGRGNMSVRYITLPPINMEPDRAC